ncbi:MFS transporter [Paenarthrobacter ilicis]|uniref:MFS family permease n=1 Tax=Paenarthrobacter ilicis TaxID=43665 RepID=A0ABX0TG52_9MICC|nr:MFS transporter [Paenarthrobacter ilicis]MBM7793551.1 MFS family permease [Paenarthrobacter ilicis]NII99731.1 MFS family permease [Paenarthrobacter ilicis]
MTQSPRSVTTPRIRPERTPLPRDIKVMLAAAFLIALGFGLVAPVLPQFATTFDVGATAAAVIVSIFAFMRLVFAPAGGALIGRFGERNVYVSGLLIVAVSTAACAFAQNYWQLLIYRGLGGAGSVMFTVAAMGLLIRLAPPERRGRVSGAYASSFLIGSVLGPVVGGLLAGFGLRVPFLAYAGALLVAAVVVRTMLSGEGRATVDSVQSPPMSLREALGDSAYRAAVFSSFGNGWVTFGVRMATIPLFAVAVLQSKPETAAWALAIFAVGNALALTFSGRLADAWGRKPLILPGLVMTGLATGVIGLTAELPWFLAASAAAGFGSGLLGPAQQAAVADVIGRGRSGGKVLAVFQMASDSGAIVGPIVAGLLADRLGYGWAFGITGGVLLVTALAWLPAREPLKPKTD